MRNKIPRRPRLTPKLNVLSMALLALVVCLLPPAVAGQETASQALEQELWSQLGLLLNSVLDQDTAALDQAICLDDMLQSRLRREQALGLIADASDPDIVAGRQQEIRSAMVDFVAVMLNKGRLLQAIDVTRISIPGGGDVERLGDAAGEPAITAAGHIALDMQGLERPVDLSVVRLADRWCFDAQALPAL